MRKSQTKTTQRVGRRLHIGAMLVVLVLGVGLGVAGPAAAGNVLFSLKTSSCGNPSPPVCGGNPLTHIPTVGGLTLVTTPNVTGGADFTVPTKIFSTMTAFTSAYPPVYPYFKVTRTRYNKAGSLMAGAWTPSVVKTFMDPDTQYPFITATPAVGRIIANVGPQGLAGPVPFAQNSVYEFTVNYGGIQQNTAQVAFTLGGPLSNNRSQAGVDSGYHVTNMTNMGGVAWAEPNIWAFTGTVTIEQPGPYSDAYFMVTAMDDRTAAGGGQIQVVSAALNHQYFVTPPVPGNGTGTITGARSNQASARLSEFSFVPVPEPGAIAMLGMGVLALASIGMKMRRR